MTNEEALAKVMQAFDEIADETLSASIRSFEPLDLTDAELASILAPYIAETAAKRAETERALRSLLARGLASLN